MCIDVIRRTLESLGFLHVNHCQFKLDQPSYCLPLNPH